MTDVDFFGWSDQFGASLTHSHSEYGQSQAESFQAPTRADSPQGEQEKTLFSLYQMSFQRLPEEKAKSQNKPFRQIFAANEIVFLVHDDHVVRWDTVEEKTSVYQVNINRSTEKLYKAFCDPTGQHLFMSTTTGDNYHIAHGSKVTLAKQLSKWKFVMESMCFLAPFPTIQKIAEKSHGYCAMANCYKGNSKKEVNWTILIGTQDGKVLESTLEGRQQIPSEIPIQMPQQQLPITSITGTIEVVDQQARLVIWLSTFYFKLELIKDKADEPFTLNAKNTVQIPLNLKTSVHEFAANSDFIVAGPTTDSPSDQSQLAIKPTWFAWLIAAGVFHSSLISSQPKHGLNIIPPDGALISFHRHPNPTFNQNAIQSPSPFAIAATESHYFVLYDDRLQAWSHLSGDLVDDSVCIMRSIDTPGSALPSLVKFKVAQKRGYYNKGDEDDDYDMLAPQPPKGGQTTIDITFRGMCTDPITNYVYVTDGDHIYTLRYGDEKEDEWIVHLGKAIDLHSSLLKVCLTKREEEKKMDTTTPLIPDSQLKRIASYFADALATTKTDAQKNLVSIIQGHCYFLSRNYRLAAEKWAKSGREFEETALALIRLEKWTVLREYVETRHQLIEATFSPDKIAKSLLGTWLVGMMLDEIAAERAIKQENSALLAEFFPTNRISTEIRRVKEQDQHSALSSLQSPLSGQIFEPTQSEKNLRIFLKANQATLNRLIVYSMLQAHGALDVLSDFAEDVGDVKMHVQLFISRHLFEEALYVMRVKEDAELYYQFSPFLIRQVGKELIAQWMKIPPGKIDPAKLIPSLSLYCAPPKQRWQENESIRFLNCVIRYWHSTNPQVHNFYVLSLARSATEDKLIEFIHEHDDVEDPDLADSGLDGHESTGRKRCYDERYALRVCMQEHCYRAAVFVYCQLGLFDEAVNLALRVDFNLAKDAAKLASGRADAALFQSLWIKIAKSVVDQKMEQSKQLNSNPTDNRVSESLIHDILDECMRLRGESDNFQLALVDILPYFPDFFCIDDFRREIEASIEESKQRSHELNSQIVEQSKMQQSMGEELIYLPQQRFITVTHDTLCAGCNKHLFLPPPDLIFSASSHPHMKHSPDPGLNIVEGFYTFPCGHVFHANCAVKVLIENCKQDEKDALRKVFEQLTTAVTSSSVPISTVSRITEKIVGTGEDSLRVALFNIRKDKTSAIASPESQMQQIAPTPSVFKDFPVLSNPHTTDRSGLIHELDELIQSDCPYCGERAIDSLTIPFIDPVLDNEAEAFPI
ncbi:putative Vacuolar protein sorting-associated protein 18 like protein [Blattamonas nauphoetae]|uniref:Vacuolar protein sorting-associated protein 18 like protein n=1 Tax=Blattamonas nauphoetae TaxID=2049346 RepID=A0ABQ9XME6_9EUKA|nr:putative Vacuolar protein sorting-associated protein 18 like protein [Blattamonas nauphoetae]